MQYYFAPLEGLTDRIYREIHNRYYKGVDRYYTPFFSPTVHRALTPRESRELPQSESIGYFTVPQLLTKNSEDFLWMAQQCADLGYHEVNLNLGCPSGTVTAKGKGAGMLRNPDQLDSFLYEIYKNPPLPVSIKTRIGFSDSDEFPKLLEIFNRYPICELIIHPRLRTAFYKGDVNMDSFMFASSHCKIPLCYNGDIKSLTQMNQISEHFPNVHSMMIGRGLIGNPGMLSSNGSDCSVLQAFHDELLDTYIAEFGGARNAMFRLKEHWSYMIQNFENSEKLAKRLRKCTDIAEYRIITREIFQSLNWNP